MARQRSSSPAGRVADLALAGLIIMAPLAAGSWKIEVLPLLLVVTAVAWFATAAALRERGRALHVGALPLVLVLLAAWTALQATPLPGAILELLSPRASALRAFVSGGDRGGPLSYESGATWREATKLLIYALVAQVARQRVRARGLRDRVAIPLVIAGLAAAGIAVLHRALGIERLFGLIDTITTSDQMLTTFVNPNHAAGFMVLTALTAIGLALDAKDTIRKLAFMTAAAIAAAVSVMSLSKGGIIALGIGLAGFGAFWASRNLRRSTPGHRLSPALVTAALLVPIIAITWRLDDLVRLVEKGGDGTSFGLAEKAAALQDALPLIADHLWTGVGRGAYVSVYTQYKTSTLQLTFAFPENIVAQLASEWGIIVGGLALLALGSAVSTRLWSSQRVLPLAMICGVGAVLVQNLVDFGLELPGIAIPVAAILGGMSGNWSGARRLPSRSRAFLGVALAAVLIPAATCAAALSSGDLPEDLAQLQNRIRAALAGEPVATEPTLERLIARHPASALMAAQAAYLSEVKSPPDLVTATKWANRALYLAPTYAGGHLVAGRLLIKAGHRRQGFGALRQAWTLSGADRRATFIGHTLDLAKTVDEIARAVPRRDPALDVISERELARAARLLVARGQAARARALIEAYVTVADAPREDLHAIAVASDAAGATAVALSAADRLLEANPDDDTTRLLAARIAFRHGETERARALLVGIEASGRDQEALLELRLRLEIEARDFPAASNTLKSLRARARPGATREVELTKLEVLLHRRAGTPSRALDALDRAISHHPGRLSLRLDRAKLLVELGQGETARPELDYILEQVPDHPAAKRLRTQIDARAP